MKKTYIIKGIKIILRYLSKYKKDLIILSILGIIFAIANAFIPFLMGRFFDAILVPTRIFINTKIEMPLFLFFLLIWFGTQFLTNFISWKSGTKGGIVGHNVYTNYVTQAFGFLLELPLSFHKTKKTGQIADKIERAAHHLSVLSNHVIIELTPQFLSIFVALIIVFLIRPLFALILLVGVLIYLAILLKIFSPLVKVQRLLYKSYSDAYGHTYDALFNIQTIKQMRAEDYEQKKIFKNLGIRAKKFWDKMTFIWQGMHFYQRLIIILTQIVIFGFSIFFIQKGQMTIGELIMFNGYAMMFFSPFVMLGYNWQAIQDGIVTVERAEKILTLSKEKYEPQKVIILDNIKGDIEFQNVYFSYKSGQVVLDEINFKVKSGEVIALVGESGVGKSTLIDLISGYYFPLKGRVLIDGYNIRNLNLKFLRSNIAVVPQEVILFNDTIENNIKYGSFNASNEEIKKAAKEAHCLEFIEKFPKKWKQIVGERGIKLSVGQKQRVAIARAILRNPRILILDEPTSALDAESEKIIKELFKKLMAGRTTFIIAHRLSTVRQADKILVLKKGKIVEQGKHEELIQIPNGTYRYFYELQIGLK